MTNNFNSGNGNGGNNGNGDYGGANISYEELLDHVGLLERRLIKMENALYKNKTIKRANRKLVLEERMLKMIDEIGLMDGWCYQNDMREHATKYTLAPNQFRPVIDKLVSEDKIKMSRGRHPDANTVCNRYQIL